MRGTVLSAGESGVGGGGGAQSKVADIIVKLDRTVFVVSLSVTSGTLRLDVLFWQRIWGKFANRKPVYYDADRWVKSHKVDARWVMGLERGR